MGHCVCVQVFGRTKWKLVFISRGFTLGKLSLKNHTNQAYLTNERLLAGVYPDVARQFVAAAEAAIAIIERTAERSLLDGRLRGSVWVLARLDWLQINGRAGRAGRLLEDLEPLAGGRTVSRQHVARLRRSFALASVGCGL